MTEQQVQSALSKGAACICGIKDGSYEILQTFRFTEGYDYKSPAALQWLKTVANQVAGEGYEKIVFVLKPTDIKNE